MPRMRFGKSAADADTPTRARPLVSPRQLRRAVRLLGRPAMRGGPSSAVLAISSAQGRPGQARERSPERRRARTGSFSPPWLFRLQNHPDRLPGFTDFRVFITQYIYIQCGAIFHSWALAKVLDIPGNIVYYSDCHSEFVLYKSSRILYTTPCSSDAQ